MRIAAAIFVALATAHAAVTTHAVYHLKTARDATVSYNTQKNSDGSFEALTPKGNQGTLTSFKGNKDYRRILLGYDLPAKIKDPSLIAKCVLHVPVPKDSPGQDYSLTAYTASSNWDEDSVNGDTKITSVYELTTVNVGKGQNPGAIDVTGACQAAAEGKFSMYVDTSQPIVTFYSKESAGKPTFTLDLTY